MNITPSKIRVPILNVNKANTLNGRVIMPINFKKCNLYHVSSIVRVVSNAQRYLLRTMSCDVNKRIKAT